MTTSVVSVNLGRPEPLPGSQSPSGICKRPVSGPVTVTRLGLEGDAVVDSRYHGGEDQAVYLYAQSDYLWWTSVLGETPGPGTFGENLTLDTFDNAALAIGDRFLIGEVLLEITAPRVPCSTLSLRMGDSGFLKTFRHALRPGAYCRVLREGVVRAGDPAVHQPGDGVRVGLLEVYQEEFTRQDKPEILRRHLAAPLAARFREAKEKRLAELGSNGAPGAGA